VDDKLVNEPELESEDKSSCEPIVFPRTNDNIWWLDDGFRFDEGTEESVSENAKLGRPSAGLCDTARFITPDETEPLPLRWSNVLLKVSERFGTLPAADVLLGKGGGLGLCREPSDGDSEGIDVESWFTVYKKIKSKQNNKKNIIILL